MEQRNPLSTIPRIVSPYVEEPKNKAGRFITLSVFVHAAMVAVVSLMSFPPPEITKPELIEIEMLGDGDVSSLADGAEAPGSAGLMQDLDGTSPDGEVAKVSPAAALPAAEQAPKPATPPPAPEPVKSASPATSAPVAKAPAAPPVPPAPPKAAIPAPKAAPAEPVAEPKVTAQETHDMKAPDLETSETGEVPVAQVDDKDMSDEFEKIDQSQIQSLALAKKNLEEEAAKAAAESEAKQRAEEQAKADAKAKQEADAQAKAEAKRQEEERLAAAAVAAEAEARRKKEAEAVAAAKAEEQAQKLREARAQERLQAEERARQRAAAEAQAAREEESARNAKIAAEAAAAREAEEARAAQAAAMASRSGPTGRSTTAGEGDGSGAGDGAQEGEGNSNSPEPTKQVAGIPGGVRTLGQLRQRPGNRFPQYEPRERLLRQEGDVVFYAYVNKDGSLSEFKKAQGTGYDNLDDKTLAALRRWKFYPGQEGWVEMPFKWSLKGEAQEAGGLLR